MAYPSRLAQAFGLVGWLLLAFATAAVGAIASVDAGAFYAGLVRPAWAPPGWVFGPVWSVLYALMGIAAWLVWREPACKSRSAGLAWFVAQLIANALWSWLFFAWHRGGLSFIEILGLLLLIVATVKAFWRVRRLAAGLMIPYLLWVGFAAVLTWAVWRNNPALLG